MAILDSGLIAAGLDAFHDERAGICCGGMEYIRRNTLTGNSQAQGQIGNPGRIGRRRPALQSHVAIDG